MNNERSAASGRDLDKTTEMFEDELFDLPLSQAKQTFEKMYLEHHIRGYEGHVAAVAQRAGRYRADVYRLLTRHGIDHANFRKGSENQPAE
jgi:DNA-binding NtrC family response regulator